MEQLQNQATQSGAPHSAPEPRAASGAGGGRSPRPRWLKVVTMAAIAYLMWCTMLFFYQDRLLFPTFAPRDPLPRPLTGRMAEAITIVPIETPEGYNEAWFVPAPGASVENPAPAVMFFHGNAEVIDYQDHIVEGYHRLGVSVMLPEYRGYGVAEGRPSQRAIREDNERFYDWLAARPEVDPDRIIFHGRSLGGGVASDLTRVRQPAALILESTFISAASMASAYLVPEFLCRHPFYNDRAVVALDRPILIGHGTLDETLPIAHGRRLRDLVPEAEYREYEYGHNDFPGDGNEPDWWGAIERIVDETG